MQRSCSVCGPAHTPKFGGSYTFPCDAVALAVETLRGSRTVGGCKRCPIYPSLRKSWKRPLMVDANCRVLSPCSVMCTFPNWRSHFGYFSLEWRGIIEGSIVDALGCVRFVATRSCTAFCGRTSFSFSKNSAKPVVGIDPKLRKENGGNFQSDPVLVVDFDLLGQIVGNKNIVAKTLLKATKVVVAVSKTVTGGVTNKVAREAGGSQLQGGGPRYNAPLLSRAARHFPRPPLSLTSRFPRHSHWIPHIATRAPFHPDGARRGQPPLSLLIPGLAAPRIRGRDRDWRRPGPGGLLLGHLFCPTCPRALYSRAIHDF
ncbi:hypothetical protein GWK47_042956 [Chionoecetes opilio]|uniref:Uncharacterized protein n=1 Tax=Chionoecetes opilio TaxID=41210 RepID=A0A8J4YHV6_CHIOP|nr:hypothetical protein GWK47_042956 [Chionoecetes opilio]